LVVDYLPAIDKPAADGWLMQLELDTTAGAVTVHATCGVGKCALCAFHDRRCHMGEFLRQESGSMRHWARMFMSANFSDAANPPSPVRRPALVIVQVHIPLATKWCVIQHHKRSNEINLRVHFGGHKVEFVF